MSAVASAPVAYAALVELFRGVCDDDGEFVIEPTYSPTLAAELCRYVAPLNALALVRAVMLGGSEFLHLTREAIGAEPFDALQVGFQRWSMAGKPGL